MALSKEDKKKYQREYMKRKRSNNIELDPDKMLDPEPVRPIEKLDPRPEDVRPVLDPVVRPCDKCKLEYDRGYAEGFKAGRVDPIAKAIQDTKNKPCITIAEPVKAVVDVYKEADISVKTDQADMATVKARYRANNPMQLCIKCHSYNKDCICDRSIEPANRPANAEFFRPVPKSIKPDKPGRNVPPATRPPSKDISPISSMLEGVDKDKIIAHHPSCPCAACKPAASKLPALDTAISNLSRKL